MLVVTSQFRAHYGCHRRINRSRAHCVTQDSKSREFARNTLHERNKTSLCCGVQCVRTAGRGRLASHEYNPTATRFHHSVEDKLHHNSSGQKVLADSEFHLGTLVFQERSPQVSPRSTNQVPRRPKFRDYFLDGRDSGLVRQVQAQVFSKGGCVIRTLVYTDYPDCMPPKAAADVTPDRTRTPCDKGPRLLTRTTFLQIRHSSSPAIERGSPPAPDRARQTLPTVLIRYMRSRPTCTQCRQDLLFRDAQCSGSGNQREYALRGWQLRPAIGRAKELDGEHDGKLPCP